MSLTVFANEEQDQICILIETSPHANELIDMQGFHFRGGRIIILVLGEFEEPVEVERTPFVDFLMRLATAEPLPDLDPDEVKGLLNGPNVA